MPQYPGSQYLGGTVRLVAVLACLAGLFPLTPATAGPSTCTSGGANTADCQGDFSAGVSSADTPANSTTINVFNLTTGITPASGTPGISFSDIQPVDSSGNSATFTINYDNFTTIGGPQPITTINAAGITILTSGGSGENGNSNGAGSGDSGNPGGTGGSIFAIVDPGPISTQRVRIARHLFAKPRWWWRRRHLGWRR